MILWIWCILKSKIVKKLGLKISKSVKGLKDIWDLSKCLQAWKIAWIQVVKFNSEYFEKYD